MLTSPPSWRRRLLKWFFCFVIPLSALVSGGCFLGTTWGAGFIANRLVGIFATQKGFELRFEDLSGSFLEGIHVRQVIGVFPSSRCNFSLNSLEISVSWSSLISGQIRFSSILCKSARIQGPPPPKWWESLPPLPHANFGCFAFPPLRFRIDRLRAESIEWLPGGSSTSAVIKGLEVDSSEGSASGKRGEQAFRGDFSGNWFGEPVVSARVIGSFSMVGPIVEGQIDGRLFGAAFRNEFHAHFGRESGKIDGYLDVPPIDIASLSRRFESLWFDKWPLKATGTFSLAGSWLLDPVLGFSGNLRGVASHSGCFIAGLNLPVVEINAEVAIHQVQLTVSDKGSFFLGKPAQLYGDMCFVPTGAAKNDLRFLVENYPVEEFIASLPWAARYGLGLPDVTGTAAIDIHVSGAAPIVRASLISEQLNVRKGPISATLNGKCEFYQKEDATSDIRISFRWLCDGGLPPLIHRLFGEKKTEIQFPSPPVSFQGALTGTSSQRLDFEGAFAAHGKTYPVVGRRLDGRWEFLRYVESLQKAGEEGTSFPDQRLGGGGAGGLAGPLGATPFLPAGISLTPGILPVDFALLSGW